jgi:hypothetical protein
MPVTFFQQITYAPKTYLFLHLYTRFLDAQLKIHLKTKGKRMNSQSSYFNADSFVKI